MTDNRKTISNAWKRLGCKCSPSTKVFLSPIRPCDHLLGSKGIFEENIGKAHIWILLNTEEFFYQNSSLLVYHSSKDIQSLTKLLRDKWNVIKWDSRLVNYRLIAQGGYGQVFVARDSVTKADYALKRIIPPKRNCLYSFAKFSLNLLQERNMFLELNQSSFFVRIFGAFQSLDKSSFWFVLDYCLTDLRKIISSYPFIEGFEVLVSDYLDGNSWEAVSEIMTQNLSTNYIDLVFMYLFEMLCALHYLATKHIIHSDIKPDNFLVSKNCHLKLTDFGVSFRNDWFHRNSMANFPETAEDIEMDIASDEKAKIRGTLLYFDPEQHIERLLDDLPSLYPELTKRLENFQYSIPTSNRSSSFLSDLYAVGLITIELITGGLQLAEYSIKPYISDDFWNIEMIYNDDLREMIFEMPLSRLPCDRAKCEIFTFLISIFTPRIIRAKDYVSLTTLFQQKSREMVPYIDISKIEKLLYYENKSITKENVQNIILPGPHFQTLLRFSDPMSKEFTEKVMPMGSDKTTFNLHPFEFNSRNILK